MVSYFSPFTQAVFVLSAKLLSGCPLCLPDPIMSTHKGKTSVHLDLFPSSQGLLCCCSQIWEFINVHKGTRVISSWERLSTSPPGTGRGRLFFSTPLWRLCLQGPRILAAHGVNQGHDICTMSSHCPDRNTRAKSTKHHQYLQLPCQGKSGSPHG